MQGSSGCGADAVTRRAASPNAERREGVVVRARIKLSAVAGPTRRKEKVGLASKLKRECSTTTYDQFDHETTRMLNYPTIRVVEMSTQQETGIEFSLAPEENQHHFRLLELPAELLSVITADNALP